jgi:hypothetical protein
MDAPVIFRERQYFSRILIFTVFLLVNIPLFTFLRDAGRSGYDYALASAGSGLLFECLISLALTLFLLTIHLETRITREGIIVRFFPLQLKFRIYQWNDIEEIFVRRYNPLLEYGGWGMRGFANNRALNIGGDTGVQLVFKDARRLLIGTQKEKEIIEILKMLATGSHDRRPAV